ERRVRRAARAPDANLPGDVELGQAAFGRQVRCDGPLQRPLGQQLARVFGANARQLSQQLESVTLQAEAGLELHLVEEAVEDRPEPVRAAEVELTGADAAETVERFEP